MLHITPLPVVVPLLAAAGLVAVRHWTSRMFNDVTAVGVAMAVVTMCALLLVHAFTHPFAYWMAGWRPMHMVSIGISFSVDAIGAGVATLASLLVCAALSASVAALQFRAKADAESRARTALEEQLYDNHIAVAQ